MKLIVGLGNPGPDYAHTRHNVGFDVVDRLAEKLGWVGTGQFNARAKSAFEALTVDGMINLAAGGFEKLILAKPMTYMNESGRSVQAMLAFFKLEPSDLLVVVDEMALEVGTIRLRGTGSDGGHNGLRSIQKMIGTNRYPRLRIGVGQPPPNIPGRDWVLGRFFDTEREAITTALTRATGCCITWADLGITPAMNQFNPTE